MSAKISDRFVRKMPLRIKAETVALWYADYAAGMSLAAVGKKYGRNHGSVREVFERRGLALRPLQRKLAPHGPNGQFLPFRPATKMEIVRMILDAKKLTVPAALKREWRHWPMERRVDFVGRLRTVLRMSGLLHGERPETEFSGNVVPFEYGTPAAMEIERRLNAGRTSQTAAIKINPCSQGVISQGQLWFWTGKSGYVGWRKGWHGGARAEGRKVLSHAIYEQHHGVKLPRHAVIRMADGNPNNLDPENLVRMSRNELARENQAKHHAAKSRAMTAALLANFQAQTGTRGSACPTNNKHEDIILTLRKRSHNRA